MVHSRRDVETTVAMVVVDLQQRSNKGFKVMTMNKKIWVCSMMRTTTTKIKNSARGDNDDDIDEKMKTRRRRYKDDDDEKMKMKMKTTMTMRR